MNVPVQLDRDSREPMYIQLYRLFKQMIEKGDLGGGEKLPPIRSVAEDLKVNNSTVISAYKLLESNGYTYSRTGSGTYVLGRKAGSLKSKVSDSDFNFVERNTVTVKADSINFSTSTPDPELFPVDRFKCVLNEVLDRDKGQAFSYTDAKGYKPLRECIVEYMDGVGVKCGINDIQIISGAQQGIDIIARVLIDYGDIIITERPTYTGAIAVFNSRGAKVAGIPIQNEGIDISELENKLKEVRPKFIYIMTNFQNPTGYSYSNKTKERLLYLAQRYDFYIIEDDYVSELYYGDRKPSLLKAMDCNDRVIFIKSFSKIFMPGIRLGFIIPPRSMEGRVLAAKHLSDLSTSGFMQRVLDMYIRKNMLQSHIENIKQNFLRRYNTITACLDGKMKYVDYYKPCGGTHLWLKLPDGLSSDVLYSQCMLHNLVISPGSAFYMDEPDFRYFRLSYASTGDSIIKSGIDLLSGIILSMKDMDCS